MQPGSCMFRMRHPNGIAELEDQMVRHLRLPHPGGRPEDFQKFIYLTQVVLTLSLHQGSALGCPSHPVIASTESSLPTPVRVL